MTSRLPTELLIEVLTFAATNDPAAPSILMQVCQYWRQVVLSSPSIWQLVSLDDRRPLPAAHAQAALYIRRSHPLPFDVHIDISQSSAALLPLLCPFFDAMDRWRSFSMSGKREESVDLAAFSRDNVGILHLCIQDAVSDSASAEQQSTFTSTPDGSLAVSVVASELAPLLAIPFPIVSLTEASLSIITQPRSILNFLASCPRLEAFFFIGWHHDDERLNAPLPIVHLPFLHTLRLDGTCGTRTILSSIDAPRLSELYLAQLNVDFHITRPAIVEDGDSDDEANDFSRSPSSDHGTGMGLRSLLRRCNPPLRVLRMDWSDMRTKDFAFVFSRLGYLESFSIEASDMSDRVIELLRPYTYIPSTPPTPSPSARYHHHRPGTATNASAASSTLPHLRIRLPRLTTLEISNCNELTGTLILDVLRARTLITDSLPAWEGSTLQEVRIADCLGFKPTHAQALRGVLGQRLRDGGSD